MQQPFSLLVKPVSADCNLNCDYCFYLEKSVFYPETKRHRMSDEILEELVKGYLSTSQPSYSFGWQGGEPTLLGVEFFEKVTGFQQKHGKTGQSVGNGLQTNATLINRRFAKHLADYKFLLGCSLDGPPEVHNLYRKTTDQQGSYDRVLRGINYLKEVGVEFNILVLVSQANVHKATEVYRYLVDNGYHFLQFIPCVEFDATGKLEPFAISGEEWGDFLCEIYDEWHRKDTHKVSIRHFDSILSQQVDGIANVCTLGENCCQYFVVEYNGDVYPCDFFVEPARKLGNIMDHSWQELLDSPAYYQFGAQKKHWNTKCGGCQYLQWCQGDCLKHRVAGTYQPHHLSHLCSGWQNFFKHAEKGFLQLSEEVKQSRIPEPVLHPPSKSSPSKSRRVGRNQLCPCGSGLKFKKCCQ